MAIELTTMSYEVRDGVAPARLIRPETANVINPASARDFRHVKGDLAQQSGGS